MTLLSLVKMMFQHMHFTWPKYVIRELGDDFPWGKLWGLNSLLILGLAPLATVLTRHRPAFNVLLVGAFVTPASPFVLCFWSSYPFQLATVRRTNNYGSRPTLVVIDLGAYSRSRTLRKKRDLMFRIRSFGCSVLFGIGLIGCGGADSSLNPFDGDGGSGPTERIGSEGGGDRGGTVRFGDSDANRGAASLVGENDDGGGKCFVRTR